MRVGRVPVRRAAPTEDVMKVFILGGDGFVGWFVNRHVGNLGRGHHQRGLLGRCTA